jgi:hypothetical protein
MQPGPTCLGRQPPKLVLLDSPRLHLLLAPVDTADTLSDIHRTPRIGWQINGCFIAASSNWVQPYFTMPKRSKYICCNQTNCDITDRFVLLSEVRRSSSASVLGCTLNNAQPAAKHQWRDRRARSHWELFVLPCRTLHSRSFHWLWISSERIDLSSTPKTNMLLNCTGL